VVETQLGRDEGEQARRVLAMLTVFGVHVGLHARSWRLTYRLYPYCGKKGRQTLTCVSVGPFRFARISRWRPFVSMGSP
jgi:hypothetical protein